MSVEIILQYVDRRSAIQIFSNLLHSGMEYGPDGQILPDWLAITRVTSPAERETWILYFLSRDGDTYEVVQDETLEIAMDTAYADADVGHEEWQRCFVPVPESGVIPRSMVP